jgi:hypothetical protein
VHCCSFWPRIFLSLSLQPPPHHDVRVWWQTFISYHPVLSRDFPFQLWKEGQSVAYRQLVNWERKFCLDVHRQNYVLVILQPMRARLPPVARSRVSLVLFCSCNRPLSWIIWVVLFTSVMKVYVTYWLSWRYMLRIGCHGGACYNLVVIGRMLRFGRHLRMFWFGCHWRMLGFGCHWKILPLVIKFCLFSAGNLILRLTLGTQSN